MPPPADAKRPSLHSPLTLRELLTPVFYFGGWALLAFLVPVVLAVIAASLAKPVYVAESRLLILLGSDYVYQGAAGSQQQAFDRSQIVNAETQILATKEVRVRALQAIGLKRAYPHAVDSPAGLNAAAEQLAKDLKIESVPQSNVVDLTLRNGDPQVASLLLDKIVQVYLERRRAVFDRSDPQSAGGQREDLRVRLESAEKALADFSNANAIGDYTQELIAVQTQQAALESQIQASGQQVASARARAAALQRQRNSLPGQVELLTDEGRSAQVEALTAQLAALQVQRRDAAAKFQDGFPLVKELDRQIASVQAAIAAAPQRQTTLVRRGANPAHSEIDTLLAAAQGEAAGLENGRGQLAQSLVIVNQRLAELVSLGPQYRDLARDRDLVQAAYQELIRKGEDTRLQNDMAREQANVRVVQPAQTRAKGMTGRTAILAAGLVLGIAAAFATVVLMSALSEVMVTPRDVEEKLRAPALAAVPLGHDDDDGRPAPGRMSADDALILLSLLSSVSKADGGVLELISARDGEGTSSLCLDLALMAATRNGWRVLVMDVEPQAGKDLETLLRRRGETLVSAQAKDRIWQVSDSTLHVTAPIGGRDWKLSDADWAKGMEVSRKNFDLVVVDAPSLQRSFTGVALAPLADLVLVVVEAETTRAAVANNLIDRLEGVDAEVGGVILNKRRLHIPGIVYERV